MSKKYLWIALTIFHVAASAAGDDKRRGAEAANSGHPAEAYRLWLPLAQSGDREVQESVALLLASGQDIGVKLSQSERDSLTLAWVTRSARNGQPSAMKWLAGAFEHGWMGLTKNDSASRCWAGAAGGERSTDECDKLSAVRPQSIAR